MCAIGFRNTLTILLLGYATAGSAPFGYALNAQATSPTPDSPSNQTSYPTPTDSQPSDNRDDIIIITAHHSRSLDILGNLSVISGEDLHRDIRGQLGESLTRQAGLSASGYAPGASRPIIRGLSGERVAIVTDGLGVIDASGTSADHAVAIEPLTTERIEILRGPAVLIFSGQAVGGVINVIDRRIPRHLQQETIRLTAIADYGTAAQSTAIGAASTVRLGAATVLHADVHYRHAGLLRSGGLIHSAPTRDRLLRLAETPAIASETADRYIARANSSGAIANSQSRSLSTGLGAAWFGDTSEVGISFGYLDSSYGLPVRPPITTVNEEEIAAIALRQYRFDLRAVLDLGDGFFEQATLRGGYSRYRHNEAHQEGEEGHEEEEEEGHEEGEEEGTLFTINGYDLRGEVKQKTRGGWSGTSGIHITHRSADIIGAEAFLPRHQQQRFALFTLQDYQRGAMRLTAALRYDHATITSDVSPFSNPMSRFNLVSAQPISQENRFKRSDGAFSAAVGIGFDLGGGFSLDGSFSRSVRTPSAEELLSDGLHAATASYERGNPNFTKEKSWGGQAAFHIKQEKFTASLTGYALWFDNFIFADDSGLVEDGLPVFIYRQGDSRLWGLELEARATLGRIGNIIIETDIVADMVRARLADTVSMGGGYLPRIPPARIITGVEAHSNQFDLRAEVEWSAAQKRHSDFENPTAGYTLVNLSLTWHGVAGRQPISLSLALNNIFDVEARRHSSFTKDFVPLAGRDFRVSLRMDF